MEDENIFSYGPYKLYKDAFDVNIRENLDKYIRTAGLTSLEEQDFRAAVDFINLGIGSYITSMSGSGTFRDNKGYLKKDNRGHQHAAKYIHTIANKQGALGNATPKEKPLAEEPSKELFDPNKHFIGAKFETEYNPTGLDSDYSYWKGTANGATLHEHLRNYIKTNYLDKGFDLYDFSKTNVTSNYYKGMLNSLYNSLADGVSDDDIKKMQILGFKNPKAFMPEQEDPPTPIVSSLSEERIKQLMDAGWDIDIATKNWVDPTGYNTQLPATVDPENPGEEYKEQYATWLQHTKGNISKENKDEDTDWTEILNTVGPIALDITNLVSPEPISSAVTGFSSDIWNFINDDNRMKNWKQHLTNVGLTGVSLLPYAGDFGTLGKIGSGLKKIIGAKWFMPVAGSAIAYITANAGPEVAKSIYTSVNKMYNKEEMTVDDYANIAQLLFGIMEVAKSGKVFYNNWKINKAATIQGDAARVTDKEGVRHIFLGEDAKKVSELSGDELNKHLKDFGIENYVSIETNNKRNTAGYIYNPETVRNMASLYGRRTLRHAQNVVGDDKMASRRRSVENTLETPPNKPVKIKTVDDLRNTVKAKLQADGKSAEVIEQVDALLRNVKMDDRGLFTKGWLKFGGAKYSDEFEQAVGILVNNGYSRVNAIKMLLSVGLHKHGGILKARIGLKINANDINLQSYKDWGNYFTYNDADKTYSLKDDYDGEALTKWGANNGLNITLPNLTYGTDQYVYTPQSSLYKEGATSVGFNTSNDLRSNLLMYDTPDTTGELDLNELVENRKMYLLVADAEKGTKSGEQLRRGDFLNWFKNNYKKGMSLELTLELYNSGIDKMYGFKLSDKGVTYTGGTGLGNDETEEFNVANFDYYTSLNGPALHGYDQKSQRQNGSGTMGRSIDRTKVTITPFTEEELKEAGIYKGGDGLFELLSTNSFTNDGTGRYYTGNADVTITKKEVEEGKEGEVSIPGEESTPIKATGDPLLRKKSPDLSPLFSAYNYYNSLKTNKDILDLSKKLPTLLYDPVEHHRSVYGNLRAVLEGLKLAAELRSMASKPLTSDGSLLMAAMMDALNQGLKYVEAGLKADDEMMRQTSEAAWQLEKENKISRHLTAMKNRENMHQTAVTKLQAEASKKTADYQSTKAFVDELLKYYITKKAEGDKKQNAVYSLNLLRDIYDNPLNYMADWNSYHDGIWKRGIKGQPLGDSEKQTFDELKQKAQQIYYNLLYYNTADVNTSVKDVAQTAADFSVIRALHRKKGGVIDVDLAKVILGYIKEANKNYNKAVDRSARGMYNYIKQQRKKK